MKTRPSNTLFHCLAKVRSSCVGMFRRSNAGRKAALIFVLRGPNLPPQSSVISPLVHLARCSVACSEQREQVSDRFSQPWCTCSRSARHVLLSPRTRRKLRLGYFVSTHTRARRNGGSLSLFLFINLKWCRIALTTSSVKRRRKEASSSTKTSFRSLRPSSRATWRRRRA